MRHKSGIYKILNIITGLFYIGSSVNATIRWKEHKWELRNDKHANKYLQNAWNKYGAENFQFQIIEYCERLKRIEREQYWINLTQCYERHIGYNLRKVASGKFAYARPTKTKAAFRIKLPLPKNKIKSKRIISELTRAKISLSVRKRSNRWPHILGSQCRCEECRIIRKIYMVEYRNAKASKKKYENNPI